MHVASKQPPKQSPILVTGSSGLLGSKIVEELATTYPVIGLDVARPEGELPERAAFLHCDLTDDHSVEDALHRVREQFGGHLSSVIHLAAYYDFSGEPSDMYEELTVKGTRRLLAALQKMDTVEQFVFSSTLLVHQPADDASEKIDERSPLRGEWDYPESKIRTEKLVHEHRGGIPAVILRIAGVYDEMGHSPPLTNQIRRIREKELESHLFPGNEDKGQPFVHIDDAVKSVVLAVERRRQLDDEEVFIIAEPETVSYGTLQDRIGELVHGRDWKTMRIPAPVARAGAWVKNQLSGGDEFIKPWMVDQADAHYAADVERARDRLGWKAEHKLYDDIERMIAELERAPERWYRENGLSS